MLGDIQMWRARIGLYCARLHSVRRGPKSSCGPSSYTTDCHSCRTLRKGASDGVLLALGLLGVAIALFSLLTVSGDIELNPGPGNGGSDDSQATGMSEKYLAHEDLRALVLSVWDGRLKWQTIGLELGIDHKTLGVISHNNRGDPDKCLSEMFQKWIEMGSPRPTWALLATTLRKNTISLGRLANKIERAHKSETKGTETALTDGTTPIDSFQEITSLGFQNWYRVGLGLGIPENDLSVIQQGSNTDMYTCKVKMLTEWFDSEDCATYEMLARGLAISGNMHLAEAICKDKGLPESTIAVSPRQLLPARVDEYADSCRKEYLEEPVLQEDPWPPPPCKKFFSLGWCTLRDYYSASWSGNNLKAMLEPSIGDDDDSNQPLKMLIDGDPGVGKTTLCRKVAQEWAEGTLLRSYDIVVLVQLRDPRKAKAKSFKEFFYHDQQEILDEVVKYVSETSGAGVLFIFDGFDELSKAERTTGSLFLDIMKGKVLKKCSAVITSRPYSSDHLQNMHTLTRHIQLLGFDEEQVFECVKESIQDEEKAQNLQIELRERNDLLKLCYIPNNCAILLYIYKQENGALPRTLTQLFEKFISNTLERQTDIDPENLAEYEKALSKIAYQGLSEDRLIFQKNEIPSKKGSTLGLLTAHKSYSSSGKVVAYNFLHLTIQEFFAAKWINLTFTSQEKATFLQEHYSNDRFRITLLFLAGITEFKDEGFRDVLISTGCIIVQKTNCETIAGLHKHMFVRIFRISCDSSEAFKQFSWLMNLVHETQSPDICTHLVEKLNRILLVDIRKMSVCDRAPIAFIIANSQVKWEKIEIHFNSHSTGSCDFCNILQTLGAKSTVRQIVFRNLPILNCIDFLQLQLFEHLEYIQVDSCSPKDNCWGGEKHPVNCRPLEDLLRKNKLKHLVLNWISPIDSLYIVDQSITPFLKDSKSLETLSLKFEAVVVLESLNGLFESLRFNKTIHVLHLSIGSYTSSCFFEQGQFHPILIQMDRVCKTRLLSEIASMLESNKVIKSFSLTRTENREERETKFATKDFHIMKTLGSLTTLNHLTISYVLLYIPLLGNVLRTNTVLTSLTITETDSMPHEIENEQFDIFYQISEGLQKNRTLKRLCLNSTSRHLHRPEDCLRKRAKSMRLEWSLFSPKPLLYEFLDSNIDLFKLFDCLQYHTSLKVIVFDFYSHLQKGTFLSLSHTNQKALFNMLLRNQSLQCLTVSGFQFTSKRLREVARALVLNGHRRDIDLTLTEQYFVEEESYKNSDIIQEEVDKFKEIMFQALVTIQSRLLTTRKQRQGVFVDTYFINLFSLVYAAYETYCVGQDRRLLKINSS